MALMRTTDMVAFSRPRPSGAQSGRGRPSLAFRLLAQEELDLRYEVVGGRALLAIDAVDDLPHLGSGREPGVDARRVRVASRVEWTQVELEPPELGQSSQQRADGRRRGRARDVLRHLGPQTGAPYACVAERALHDRLQPGRSTVREPERRDLLRE